jgi:alkanesulfonate monooxygenase SsuD/methylene tetrahydromethanopterin reductase-like flavin-dependent oxidoreductase (luciferase family)
MEIGIGLPNTVLGADGRAMIEWARRAEAAGFSTLGTVGRLAYDSFDDLITLTAAAAVTERIRLTTGILVGPLFANDALLAKQAATLDRVSGGRFVLGIGLGGRPDDFVASGIPTEKRGKRLDAQLTEIKAIWAREAEGLAGDIGPVPARPGGPEIVVGGYSDAAYRRTARFGDGWMMGAGGSPEAFAAGAAAVEDAWRAAGRSGAPRKLKPHYFALGPDASDVARAELSRYYANNGAEVVERLVGSTAIGAGSIRETVEAFRERGCDELILSPCSPDLEQVELLADALGGLLA